MEKCTSKIKPLLLIFPYDVMAHYLRCLQLCGYLKPYFRIKFIYSEKFYSFIREAGFETFECASLDSEKVQRCMTSFDFSWLNEPELNCIYTAQVKIITVLKPAAVLGDMSPTLKMAAEQTGVFHFSLHNGYMTQYYACIRRMSRKHPFHSIFNLLPPSIAEYMTNVGEQLYFRNLHAAFRRIRKRYGLSKKYTYLQELEGDANLVCDLQELFPQIDLPSNYFAIPPLYHPLQDIPLEEVPKLDLTKKTLFVSMGSTGNWKDLDFLNNNQFNKYNIVTAGDTDKILKGCNVFSYSFINNKQLFKLTDLVICHGGNGTIYQSLSCGIPILCKTTHVEQEYNADGLERLGLGQGLDKVKKEDYITVIDKWIKKKHSKEFVSITNNIQKANNRFEETIEDLLNISFHQNFLKKQLFKSEVH